MWYNTRMKYKKKDLNKIKERIQKLLNMTVENGCTEAEADVARGKAESLLFTCGLKMEEVQNPNWVTLKASYIISDEQRQRAFCEQSRTKAHYYILDERGEGKCWNCGRPYGLKDWSPILELAPI